VKVLFDNNTPAPLAKFLSGHEVIRAAQLGWERLRNGELLTVAEGAEFDVLVTCDQNLPYQQNLANRKIAIVILSTSQWPDIRPAVPKIGSAIDFVQRGQVVRIEVR
jgi:hypothetical protein